MWSTVIRVRRRHQLELLLERLVERGGPSRCSTSSAPPEEGHRRPRRQSAAGTIVNRRTRDFVAAAILGGASSWNIVNVGAVAEEVAGHLRIAL